MRFLPFLVILAVIVVAVVIVFRPRGLGRTQPGLPDELVKDPVCGTYIVRSRAVRGAVPHLHFCSRECARRYATETRG